MNKLIEIDELKKENKQLQQDLYIALNKIDKAIEYINDLFNVIDYDDEEFITFETLQRILKILGDKE